MFHAIVKSNTMPTVWLGCSYMRNNQKKHYSHPMSVSQSVQSFCLYLPSKNIVELLLYQNDIKVVYVSVNFLCVLKMAPRVLKLCFAFVRSIPVVFITAVIAWSYYAYVIQMCICTYKNICILNYEHGNKRIPFFR